MMRTLTLLFLIALAGGQAFAQESVNSNKADEVGCWEVYMIESLKNGEQQFGTDGKLWCLQADGKAKLPDGEMSSYTLADDKLSIADYYFTVEWLDSEEMIVIPENYPGAKNSKLYMRKAK